MLQAVGLRSPESDLVFREGRIIGEEIRVCRCLDEENFGFADFGEFPQPFVKGKPASIFRADLNEHGFLSRGMINDVGWKVWEVPMA